ncbi:MAG TPA: sugar ABC transporter ATP-binding protein [Anaerolineae bacterium]|nr:sugar ABC transporter ATP-binding protein [Anaerolineae bacterium]
MNNKSNPILSTLGIHKSFNSVEVLHGVEFNLRKGEIHGLVGKNGAGKSTLMKIVSGVYTRDEGRILIKGKEVDYDTPVGAMANGIAMVFQEFSLIPTMTVAQNMFLTREPMKGMFIDEDQSYSGAVGIFQELKIIIDPNIELSQLSVGKRQIVEIAKAISQNASILIMDEPTSSLSSVEIQSLFTLIRRLKEEDISIIFVSHHLNEVMDICDRVTVIRDGKIALSDKTSMLNLEKIVSAMVAKKITKYKLQSKQKIKRTHPLLEANSISSKSRFSNVTIKLYPGEILGIAGVMGSGRTELLKSIYGILRLDKGKILIKGNRVNITHPAQAIEMSIIHVPEDRRKNGVIYGQSLRMNVLLPIWKKLSKKFIIQENRGKVIVEKLIHELDIKTPNIDQLVERLSGGNQQKVVFAKSLSSEPNILLLDDPTVGVDIATKKEIAQIIRRIAGKGNGVIIVSSEMAELAELCDRILVLRRGKIIQEIDNMPEKKVTEEMLLRAIQGERKNKSS